MTNDEKLVLLNSIEVLDSSACAGELECVYIEPTVTNKAKLKLLGVTEIEIESNLDDSGESMDIVPFISNHVKYGWFQEGLGGFLRHMPISEMKLQSIDLTETRTYKEILRDYGIFDYEIVEKMTEEECKWQCDDINGAHMTEEELAAEGDWPDSNDVMDEH